LATPGSSVSKFLLVDDHPIIVAAYRWLLERDDATTVLDANDVSTGYQAFLQHKPVVIVVDLRLQGEDLGGLALIKRIRSYAPHAAILAFSMHLDPVVIIATIRAGATGHLLKDAPPEELANAVEHVRSGRRILIGRLHGSGPVRR
jgi:DNA-binding NarL/FixJ family response regulator